VERSLGKVLAGQEDLRAGVEKGLDTHHSQRVGALAKCAQ